MFNFKRINQPFVNELKKYVDIQVIFNLNCNFKCEYCYDKFREYGKKDNFLNIQTMIKSIEKIKANKSVTILGGEPTLSKYLKYFSTKLREDSYIKKLILVTNTSNLINDDILKNFDIIQCSFHSTQISTKQFKNNVLYYKNKNKTIWVTCCYQNRTKEKIKEISSFCKENKIFFNLEILIIELPEWERGKFEYYNINYDDIIDLGDKIVEYNGNQYNDLELLKNNLRNLKGCSCSAKTYILDCERPYELTNQCFHYKLKPEDIINDLDNKKCINNKCCNQYFSYWDRIV